MSVYQELVDQLKANHFNTTNLDSVLTLHILPENDQLDITLELIIENQRGLKLFGIPLFSSNILFPLVDPPPFQRLDGLRVSLALNAIANYPLPDLGWQWGWDQWYVLMLADVDEQGWVYLLMFLWLGHRWHGKYYFADFVRRRLWVRMRQREKNTDADL